MPPPILPASKLKVLGIKGVNCLQVFWSPYHAYSLNATRARESFHPQYEAAKRRWEGRRDPFWWSCLISTKAGGNKRVVRNWLARRGRVAITDALKRKGYAKNGARLVEGSGKADGGDLVGSANILVGKEMLHTSFQDLQRQADLVIQALMYRQNLDKPRRQEHTLPHGVVEGTSQSASQYGYLSSAKLAARSDDRPFRISGRNK